MLEEGVPIICRVCKEVLGNYSKDFKPHGLEIEYVTCEDCSEETFDYSDDHPL